MMENEQQRIEYVRWWLEAIFEVRIDRILQGYRGTGTLCPIAQTLKEVPGIREIWVGRTVIRYTDADGVRRRIKMPKAIQWFPREFDSGVTLQEFQAPRMNAIGQPIITEVQTGAAEPTMVRA